MQSRGAFSVVVFQWALSGAPPKTLIAECVTPLFSAINRAKLSGTFQGERASRECAALLFRAGGRRKQDARVLREDEGQQMVFVSDDSGGCATVLGVIILVVAALCCMKGC